MTWCANPDDTCAVTWECSSLRDECYGVINNQGVLIQRVLDQYTDGAWLRILINCHGFNCQDATDCTCTETLCRMFDDPTDAVAAMELLLEDYTAGLTAAIL